MPVERHYVWLLMQSLYLENIVLLLSLQPVHIKMSRIPYLPQAELAKQFGVQATTIYRWEHGICAPSRRFFGEIVRFLGYDPRSSSVFRSEPQTAQPAELAIEEVVAHKKYAILQ